MLTHSERGRLGGLKTLDRKIKENNIANYNKNPKLCTTCENVLPYEKREYKFCSRSCSAVKNNLKRAVKRYCLQCKELLATKNSVKYCSRKCYNVSKVLSSIEKLKSGTLNDVGTIRRLVKLIFPYECSVCNLKSWCNKSITLQVDHIDGNYLNNKLDNLRLICPNCHSQTETFGIKNLGKGRHKRRERYAQGKSN